MRDVRVRRKNGLLGAACLVSLCLSSLAVFSVISLVLLEASPKKSVDINRWILSVGSIPIPHPPKKIAVPLPISTLILPQP